MISLTPLTEIDEAQRIENTPKSMEIQEMHLVGGLRRQEKALTFSEKPKRRSELMIDIFGVPGTEQKCTISHRNEDCCGAQRWLQKRF